MKKLLSTIIVFFSMGLFLAVSGQATKAVADDVQVSLLTDNSVTVPGIGNPFIEKANPMTNQTPGYLLPRTPDTDCMGYPLDEYAKEYYFGFKRLDGYCGTMNFLSNGDNEVWVCARAFCDSCSEIEDITERYKSNPSILGGNGGYCPAR